MNYLFIIIPIIEKYQKFDSLAVYVHIINVYFKELVHH